MLPLPQRCTLPAHEEATILLSLLPSPWPLPLQSLLPSPSPLLPPLLLLLLLPIAVAVAIGHCCCGRHPLLPSLSLLRCRQPLPSPLPSPLAIAVSVTIGHCSCHLHWPSPLLSLSAIAKSCCLGAARIVLEHFKQIMLTLFNLVWTVGGALIKAG